MNTEQYNAELKRLRSEGAPDEPCDNGFPVTINARTHSDTSAHETLSKVVDVLERVITTLARGEWPSTEEWASSILPRWLADAFSPEMSAEDVEQWLSQWRAADFATQVRMEKQKGWSLEEWLHWFAAGPDERQWCWGNAAVQSDNSFDVTIFASGTPFASGALTWLIEAAGAEQVTLLDI